MKNIIDLTIPLGPETPLYPGDPKPQAKRTSKISEGDLVTASHLELGVHTGTHVDLPAHFIEGGKVLGDYTVQDFVGQATVLDLVDRVHSISKKDLLKKTIPHDQHILLKTHNSSFVQNKQFCEDYIYLEPEAADYILQHNPRSIGIDYYSLDPMDSETLPAHFACAEYGLPVFVCLDLTHTKAGSYNFAGLALNYPSLEGVPVRAIVWNDL